jgi:TonB family protein
VSEVLTLRETPPFTELLRHAVTGWRFQPSRQDGRAQAWPVLVAGIFRPPTLVGPAAGTPPRDTATPSSHIPIPLEPIVPPYPPSAVGDAVVLVEVGVGEDGTVAERRVVEGRAPFVDPALDAVRNWRFRPARREGHAVTAFAYVVFSFRGPIGPPPKRPGGRP